MTLTITAAAAALPTPYAMPSRPALAETASTAIRVPEGPCTVAGRCRMRPGTDIHALLATAFKVERVITSKGVICVWFSRDRSTDIWKTEGERGAFLERTTDAVIMRYWRTYRERQVIWKTQLFTAALGRDVPYTLDHAVARDVEHIVISVLHNTPVIEEIGKEALCTRIYSSEWSILTPMANCRRDLLEVIRDVNIVHQQIQKDFAELVASFKDMSFKKGARVSLDTVLVDPTTGNLWVWAGFHGKYQLEHGHLVRLRNNKAFPKPLYLWNRVTQRVFSGYPVWKVDAKAKMESGHREWEFSYENPSEKGKWVTHVCKVQMGEGADQSRIIWTTIDKANAVPLIAGDLENVNVALIAGKTAELNGALGQVLSAMFTSIPVAIIAEYLFGIEISPGDSLTHHTMNYRHFCNLSPSLKPRPYIHNALS